MKKILLLALSLVISFMLHGQTACQRATTALQCGQVVSNCANGTANNAMNGTTYWCLFDAYGSGSTGRDTVFKLQVDQTTTYRFILEMLNGKDMDIIIVKPTDFNNQCLFINSCTQANGGFSYEYNHVYGIYREVLDIRLDPNPTPYLVFIDSKEPGQALFNLTVDCTCTGIEANNDLPTGDRIFCDDFENYVADEVIEPQSTRWERPDTTLPDGQIVSAGFLGQGVRFQGSTGSEPEDHFLLRNRYSTTTTAGQSEGRYRISWKMRMEHGKKGYYAVEHLAPVNVPGGVFNDAYHVNFLGNGLGELRLGSSANAPVATFPYPPGTWMNIVQIIDIDANVAELWINDNFVKSWTFSVGSGGNSFRLGSVKFKAGVDHDFKVDELCVWKASPCNPPAASSILVENGVSYSSEAAARCALYTSLEWGDGFSLCQYGGTLIHRADQYFGELDNSDFAPSLLRTDPCVQAAYGNNVPFPLYADIYLFYKDDNQQVDVLFNDNGNASMRQFVFSCNYLDNGNCIRGQQCLTEIGNTGYFLPNTCDSFYYIVVTSGAVNDNYDLTIVPEGECGTGFNVLDIPCNGVNGELNGFLTFLDEQVTATSQFNANGPGNAYENCYNGNRDYNGGEEIYRFTLESPAIMTFQLTGSSPMGMALYTFLCGKDCIAFSETKGPLNKATLKAPLLEGTYHLIIDKSVADNLRMFDLEVECQKKSFFDIQALLSCERPEDQAEPVVLGKVPPVCLTCLIPSPLPQDRHEVIINNLNKLSVGDAVHFLFRDSLNQYLTGSPVLSGYWDVPNGVAKSYMLPEDYVSPTLPGVDIDSLQCSFKEGDTLFIYMTESANGDHKFREIIPTFLPPNTGEATAGNEFAAGQKSIVSFFELGNVVTWYTDKTAFETTDGQGTREIKFDANIPWTVEKVPNVPWLTLADTAGPGDGIFSVLMDFEPNTSLLPRTTTLRFVSTEKPDIYRLYVVVTQLAPCTQPEVEILTLNSSLCDGDTLTLLADVGTDPITGQSLAPLFDFTWKNGDGVQVYPLDFPPVPDQFNVILNTGSYTYSVEVSNKYCDGIDTDPITVTITPPPPTPTPSSQTASTICAGDPFPTFSVIPPATGQVIQWFDASTGGNLLAEGVNFTPNEYITRTFYAGAVFANGDCSSPSRVAFSFTVNPLPTVEIQEKVCTPDHQFYQFNVVTNAGNVFLNGIPLAGSGGIFPVFNIDKDNSVSIRVANQFCDTTLIVQAPICICDVADPGFIQNYSICEGLPAPEISVSITQPDVSVNWYDAPLNGVKLNQAPVNPFVPQPPFLSSYYAQAVNLLNGCTSPGFRVVSLTVLPQPSLVLIDTVCTQAQDFYTISLTSNGTDVTATAGNKMVNNNTYTFSQIPINQSIVITATGSNGCTRVVQVNPPNCPCLAVQAPVSGGDVTICYGSPYPELRVEVGPNQTANWYLAGNNVALGVTTFIPQQPGVYLVETFDPQLSCTSADKTAVEFAIFPEIPFNVSMPLCAYDRQSYTLTITTTSSNTVVVNGLNLSGNNGTFVTGNLDVNTNAQITVTDVNTQCQAFGNVIAPECPCVEQIDPPVGVPSNNFPVCQYQAKNLTVEVGNNETANWYNAQNQLVQSATTLYGPSTQIPGVYTYFVETYNPTTDCTGPERTAVTFTVHPAPTVQVTKVCNNQTQYTVTATVSNANTLTATIGTVTSGPGINTFTISEIPLGTPVELTVSNTQTACASNFNVSPPVNCDCSLLGDVTAPNGGPNQLACFGQAVFPTLTAFVVQPNVVIDWYDANGNLIIAGTSSYSPPANLQTGLYLYYAEARNTLTQCVSNTRTEVQLTVSDLPLLLLTTVCESDFLTYKIQGQTDPGNTISNNAGVFANLGSGFFEITGIPKGIACSVTVTNPATTCQRNESVLLSTCPCPVVNNPMNLGDQVMCQGDPTAPVLAVSVQNPGTETVTWYDGPVGGFPVAQGLSFQPAPPMGTRSYFAETLLQNGFCPSPGRTEVKLEVRTRPTAVAGSNQSICEGDTLELNGTITGVSGGFWSATAGQFLPDNGALSADYFVAPFGLSPITLTLVTDNPAGPCPAVSSSMELSLLDAPEIEIDTVYCNGDFQSYNVFFTANTAILTTNLGPATPLANQQYRVSNIPLNTDLQITGFNTGTSCNTAITVAAPNPCTCPTISMPVSLNGNVIEHCANLGLPTLTVNVNPGQIANWYQDENSTVPILPNALTFSPIFPGDYFVEAVDPENGCASTRLKITLTIKQAPVIFIGPDAAFCAGSSTTLTADAGVGYSYSWSGGETSQQISVNTAGVYYVSISLNGCTALDSFVITQHPILTASISVSDSINCFGYMDGQLSATAQGGTLPIDAYFWSIQSGQPTISGLSSGVYSVTLADHAGCTAVASIDLTQPPQLTIGNVDGQPAVGGQANGFISIQPSGGTPPLHIQWSQQDSVLGNQTQNLLDSISNDVYSVIVTDANGCTVGSGSINLASVSSFEPGFNGQISVFPNPTSGRLQIKISLPEYAVIELQVWDVLGRNLLNHRATSLKEGQIELDLGNYPAGLYWLKVKIGDQLMVKKIALNR